MRHFVEELDYLRSRLLEMSSLVEDSVYRSVLCLTEKDPQQAQKVLQNEAEINRMEIDSPGCNLPDGEVRPAMQDLTMLLFTVVFFGLAFLYVKACQKLR